RPVPGRSGRPVVVEDVPEDALLVEDVLGLADQPVEEVGEQDQDGYREAGQAPLQEAVGKPGARRPLEDRATAGRGDASGLHSVTSPPPRWRSCRRPPTSPGCRSRREAARTKVAWPRSAGLRSRCWGSRPGPWRSAGSCPP